MGALGGAPLRLVDAFHHAVRESKVDLVRRLAGLSRLESRVPEETLRDPVVSKVVDETLPPARREAALSPVALDQTETFEDR